jgi:phosphoenolpyruvate carboxykinase (ATP)
MPILSLNITGMSAMKFNGRPHTDHGLDQHGLYNLNAAYWNLPTPELYEQAILRHEGSIAHMGPLVVRTGHHTGGSAEDRFVVEEASSSDDIWWGRANKPIPAERFDLLHQRLASYLQMKEVYVQDCFLGADPGFRLPVRVITEYAWHSLFAHNLFIQPDSAAVEDHEPEFTIIDVPRFHAVPSLDRTRSETFVLINFAKRLALIGGTSYAGEIKKALFAVVNYLMPARGVFPMHCAANQGRDGGVALFFGVGGAGKTTLSADRTRCLIGDDAHGWGPHGVFNFEGGCYAKMIRLSPEEEPDIFATTQRFGTVLENVTVQAQTRRLDLNDDSLTENTRGAYHISAIPNAVPSGVAGHPESLIFLTCDAFGVLPPVARLSTAQALYHFLCGYTARLPGRGSGRTEPTPVFSPCYGAPYVPLHPKRYADLLRHRLEGHRPRVWLVNTGWSGGPWGEGRRIELAHTRALVSAILAGELDRVETRMDPVFGFEVPLACPGVPAALLDPRSTWPDPAAYDTQARWLAGLYRDNFNAFAGTLDAQVRAAGPRED